MEHMSKKSPAAVHILTHWFSYLLLLAAILFAAIFLHNYGLEKSALFGAESYYHLTNQQLASDLIMSAIASLLPHRLIYLLAPMLALLSLVVLRWILADREEDNSFSMLFLLLVVISPVFLYTFSTFSAYALATFLILLGFLLLQKKSRWCMLPFALASTFDFTTSMLMLMLVSLNSININLGHNKKWWMATAVGFVAIIFFIILSLPVAIGPFHDPSPAADLVSDLGGHSGIPFFSLMLAILGMVYVANKPQYYPAYLLLVISALLYVYNTHTILYLSMVILFFAAHAAHRLLYQTWEFQELRKITFFILMLGLLFSTLTFISRLPEQSPSWSELAALQFIKDNSPPHIVVFSYPQNAYLIRYYAQREPFARLDDAESTASAKIIYNSTYVTTTEPVLRSRNATILLITPAMKASLPEDRGLLFLLRSEKFKLLYAYKNTEVWQLQAQKNAS